MAAEPKQDLAAFGKLKSHAQEVRTDFSIRNSMFVEMEKMFLLSDDVPVTNSKRRAADQDTKRTLSPDPRDNLLGAWRLIIATDPQFKMPHEANSAGALEQASKIEMMAKIMWMASGRQVDSPVHFDALLSAMLYDEMHLAVVKTSDLVDQAKGASPAAMARVEQLSKRTPYFFEVWNPKNGFYERDALGLSFYYKEQTVKAGLVLDRFGQNTARVLGTRSRWSDVTLCRAWDLAEHATWVAEVGTNPIVMAPHTMPFIPVAQQLINGSRLFSKPHEQVQPFLYTIWKSGMWDRANLALTVFYTILFALGTNPLLVYTADKEGKKLNVSWGNVGGLATIKTGESLGTMFKQLMDPEMFRGLEIAQQKMTESTIYRQALGEPLSGDAPFAALSLLHQSGRLPLINAKRLGSWGIGKAIEMAIRWMKADGVSAKGRYREWQAELNPEDIPDDFEIDVALEIDLPQDRLQAAAIAARVTEGEDPLASKEWARENVMQIGASDEMQKQIWDEKAANLRAMQFFAGQLLELKTKMEQAMAPPNMAPPGGGGMTPPPAAPPPPGGPPPGGGSPEEMAMAGQLAQQGPPVPGPEGGMVAPETVLPQ